MMLLSIQRLCNFVCRTVQYFGRTITPQSIKPNSDRIIAVQEYPLPGSVKEVKQFLGLVSSTEDLLEGSQR